jgi:calpain family cysteine protease/hemolysin type calcium-binding protein
MKRSLPTLFRSKNHKRRPKAIRSRTFEALEDRRLMAITPVTVNPDPSALFDPTINSPAVALVAGIKSSTLYIRGTDKADNINLRQTNSAITIDGLSGSFNTADFQNIVIRSFGGGDTINLKSEAIKGQQAITKATKIWSGAGADQVTGGRGNDAIFTEDGIDKVWANYGNDIIDGGANDDELHGELGADKIFGDLGADKLYGEDGADILIGGNDTDYLYGGKGVDHLDGSLGYDYLYGQDDYDYLNDDSGLKSDSGSNQISNTSSIVLSWFDRNLLDAPVRTEARYDYATDYTINRTEMMSIFDAAKDGYTIDANELADLQNISGKVDLMPYYVRDLAGSVMSHDVANLSYQGTYLGSFLAAGDSSAKLEKLVDKWFLGQDRPLAQYHVNSETHTATYQFVQGSLFQNGISYTDVGQGATGDCYFLAALGSLAKQKPSMIQDMFIDNGDNTFTVRFYKSGVAHYVTVDRFLPTPTGDDAIYYPDRLFAYFGTDINNQANELWVALAEKAFAQFNESNNSLNSYQEIGDGGISAAAMVPLTGSDAGTSSISTMSSDQIINKLNSGKLLALSTLEAPLNNQIVGHHAYAIVGYNATTGKFSVFNPWGVDRSSDSLTLYPATLDLTFNEIVSNFNLLSYT